jgi:hypothetical protein
MSNAYAAVSRPVTILFSMARSRISKFMNRFRNLGFVSYKGQSPITIRTAKLSKFVMAY